MNSLFPVKFESIYFMLENNDKWLKTTKTFSEMIKSPNEDYVRHLICSPNVQQALKNKGYEFGRFRLAFPKENLLPLRKIVRSTIEIYSSDGDFIGEIPYNEWDFELSLALESELLGIILNINQY